MSTKEKSKISLHSIGVANLSFLGKPDFRLTAIRRKWHTRDRIILQWLVRKFSNFSGTHRSGKISSGSEGIGPNNMGHVWPITSKRCTLIRHADQFNLGSDSQPTQLHAIRKGFLVAQISNRKMRNPPRKEPHP